MRERWKPVPGFEGRYEASDQGRVRSLIRWNRKPTPRLLSPSRHQKLPYRKVRLADGEGNYPTMLVHRVIMEAFVGPCPDGMEVRHLDGDPENNRLDNLAYGTRAQNQRDAVRHGTHHNANKDECPQGHPYTGNNVRVDGHARKCRECLRERERRRYRESVGELQVPRFSEDVVGEAMQRYFNGERAADLMEEYGVSKTHFYRWVRRSRAVRA